MDTSSLMEQILSKENLNAAYLQVVRNKGAAGVDGMTVEELGAYLSENGESMSGWILIDFGAVLVHVMTAEVRDRYNLEGLWGDKPNAEALKKLAEHQK